MEKIKKQIEFTTQEDIGNTTPVTYKSYITGLSGQPYKHFIMLAELIDNAISSFENEYVDGKWDKKLEMKMTFDFSGKVIKSDKEGLNFKYVKDSYILVEDNGFGMKNEYEDPMEIVLKKSLILDNANQQRSDKNVWGRGMKQCAYFFGQDLKVTTSNGIDTFEVYQKFTDPAIELTTPYRINPFKVEGKNKSGTTIRIENIYDNERFNLDTFKLIINSLEWRYINYINEKKLDIKCTFRDNETKVESLLFKPMKEEVLLIDEDIKSKISENIGIEEFKNDIENQFELIQNSIIDDDLEELVAQDVYNKLKQLFIVSLGGNSTPEFKIKTKFQIPHTDTEENISVPFEFWALPEKKRSVKKDGKKENIQDKDAGIRLFEGLRAVTHISIKDKDVGPWMGWVKRSDKSWRTEKRFAGTLDMKLIGARPTVDKSKFGLSNEITTLIEKNVWTVYRVYWIFMRIIMKRVSMNQKPDEVYIKLDELEASTKENISSEQVKFNKEKSVEEERIYNFKYPNEGNEWEIDLVFDYMDSPSHIIHPIINHSENFGFRVIVYRQHTFWNLIRTASKDNEKQFILDIIMPIIHLIVKSSIKMTNPTLAIEKINQEAVSTTEKFTSGDETFERR